MKKHLVSILSLLFVCYSSYAQMKVEYKDTMKNSWDTNINVHQDPRLDILVAKHTDIQKGLIRSGRGYRVQIYYGNDRAQAIQRKIDFMRRFPQVKAYMSYIQPQYRVKVGDFPTRAEAAELYRQTIALYGACMIVPDRITVNTLKDD